jgi:hypothetical protein
MKILNLQKLTKAPDRELEIDGVKHPVHPLSVEGFIETTHEVQKIMESEGGGTLADHIESSIKVILRSVPTLTRDQLVVYTPEALQTIFQFVRGDDVEQAEVAAGEAGNAGGK